MRLKKDHIEQVLKVLYVSYIHISYIHIHMSFRYRFCSCKKVIS